MTTKRTARAWLYKEQLREILGRKQINVVRAMLWQWTVNVMRSKVEPMKAVARMIRKHLEGTVVFLLAGKLDFGKTQSACRVARSILK